MGFPESDLPSSAPEDIVENTRKLHVSPASTHRPSMLLDAEHDRPLEVEPIIGEVVRMGRKFNVEMPVSYIVTSSRVPFGLFICTAHRDAIRPIGRCTKSNFAEIGGTKVAVIFKRF
jgi:hypothetical protein